MGKPMYGKVDRIKDVETVNGKIRGQIRKATTTARLQELLSRSRYLYTLSFTKAWKNNFRGKLTSLRKKIKSEYTKTSKLANQRAKTLGIKAFFDIKID